MLWIGRITGQRRKEVLVVLFSESVVDLCEADSTQAKCAAARFEVVGPREFHTQRLVLQAKAVMEEALLILCTV